MKPPCSAVAKKPRIGTESIRTFSGGWIFWGWIFCASTALLLLAQGSPAPAADESDPYTSDPLFTVLVPPSYRDAAEREELEREAAADYCQHKKDYLSSLRDQQATDEKKQFSEAHARSTRKQAQDMRCDALLKGSAECLAEQQRLYNAADNEERRVEDMQVRKADIFSTQKDYDACLASQRLARQRLATPDGTPPGSPKTASGPTTSTPPPLPPVAVGPSVGPLPPNVPPAVTPPAPGDTLTCNYTDASGQQKTSFTTKDPEFLKQGCPPNIFPGLILVKAPPWRRSASPARAARAASEWRRWRCVAAVELGRGR
jgi:hypothetical protein